MLASEDGTDRSSRNVGMELLLQYIGPIYK